MIHPRIERRTQSQVMRCLAMLGMAVGLLLLAFGALAFLPWVEADPKKPRVLPIRRIGGRFVDADTRQGVVPVTAEISVRRSGESAFSSTKAIPVTDDGSFRVVRLGPDVVAIELLVEFSEPYLRMAPIIIGHESAIPRDSTEPLMGPVLQPAMDLLIPVARGGFVRGTVHVEGKELPESASVMAFWNPISPFDVGGKWDVPIEDSGSFRLSRIPVDWVVRVAVGGLGSGLLSSQVNARSGDSEVQLHVTRGHSIRGLVFGHRRNSRVHVVGPRFDCSTCFGALGHGVEVDRDGAFLVEGLASGAYDIVVRQDDQVYAVASGVAAGSDDVELGPPDMIEVHGTLKGLPADVEAGVEVWWASCGVPIAGTRTEGGCFSLALPAGIRLSILARAGQLVSFVDELAPPLDSLVLDFERAVDIHAKIKGASGPVFVMVGRGGYRLTGWVPEGADLRFASMPPGAYEVQLLSKAQAHSYLFSRLHILTPFGESWLPTKLVEAGDPNQELQGL